jgi:hypothetical protein
MIIIRIFQKILYFPSKKFGLWKNILKQFAENKIISVEATTIEHVIKWDYLNFTSWPNYYG